MYCKNCGTSLADDAKVCDLCGSPITSSPDSNTSTTSQNYTSANTETEKSPYYVQPPQKENLLLGTLGAIIGAIIGGASIILFSRMGYVAAISGLLLAFCTAKGYSLLGKVVSKKGFFIIIILILVTPYIANQIDWAILICQTYSDFDITFGEAYSLIGDFLDEGIIEKSLYIRELLMIYLFAAIGAIGTLKNMFSD